MGDDWLSIEEAARRIGVDPDRLEMAARHGHLGEAALRPVPGGRAWFGPANVAATIRGVSVAGRVVYWPQEVEEARHDGH